MMSLQNSDTNIHLESGNEANNESPLLSQIVEKEDTTNDDIESTLPPPQEVLTPQELLTPQEILSFEEDFVGNSTTTIPILDDDTEHCWNRLVHKINNIRSNPVGVWLESNCSEEEEEMPPLLDLLQSTHSSLITKVLEAHLEIQKLRAKMAVNKGLLEMTIVQTNNPDQETIVRLYGHEMKTPDYIGVSERERFNIRSSMTMRSRMRRQWGSNEPSESSGLLFPIKASTVQNSVMEFQFTSSQDTLLSSLNSPIDSTPRRYEQINILQQNNTKMLLYMNPKLDLHQSERQSYGSSSRSGLVSCFHRSEIDFELEEIFKHHPPAVHTIVRKKSRKERGSSVPHVDSFRGTSDLIRIGHASYFIPTLSLSERATIGWKPTYFYGQLRFCFRRTTQLFEQYDQFEQNSFFDNNRFSFRLPIHCQLSQGNNSLGVHDENENIIKYSRMKRLKKFLTPNCTLFKCILPSCFTGNLVEDEEEKEKLNNDWSTTEKYKSGSFYTISGIGSVGITTTSQDFPRPILVPVLNYQNESWFFGRKPPKHHDELLAELKVKNQLKETQELPTNTQSTNTQTTNTQSTITHLNF